MVAQAITVVNGSSKGRSSNNDYKAAAVTAVRTELALLAAVAAEVVIGISSSNKGCASRRYLLW